MSLVVMYLAGAVADGLARVVAVLRRAAWVAVAVGVVLLLDGCATVALPGAPWGDEPFPRFVPADLPDLPDDVPPAVALDAGEAAPFDGNLLAVEEVERLEAVEAQLGRVGEALDLCYDGREDDRGGAEVVFGAREVQIRQGRVAQGRAFGAGGGIGGIVGLIVGLIVGVNAPR